MPATCSKKENGNGKFTARVRLHNILFASDFSPASNLAQPFATGLAKCFGANLYAVNVQEPINAALPPETWQSVELTHKMEASALRQSLQREYPEIVPQIVNAEGVVWREIENIVKKLNIDLVVIGTRGRDGIGRFLLGSQAEEILRHSTCPVYTVGPNVTAPERHRGQMRSIVFATDFGPASTAAAPFAVSLAEECATRLSLVYVVERREVNEFLPSDSLSDGERRLEALLPADARLWCDPTFVIEHGEPSEKILEVARAKQADLIVMGVHATGVGTRLSDATVHKVLAHARCPVMTVPTPKTDA